MDGGWWKSTTLDEAKGMTLLGWPHFVNPEEGSQSQDGRLDFSGYGNSI